MLLSTFKISGMLDVHGTFNRTASALYRNVPGEHLALGEVKMTNFRLYAAVENL